MKVETLKRRYYGSLASTYDRERVSTPLWKREQAAVESFLSETTFGQSVLDVPIGTGRFLAAYQRQGLRVSGLDASVEMLAQSRAKADEMGLPVSLHQGDLRRLPFDDASFDLTVCIRFLNWIGGSDLASCIFELTRVTRPGGAVILGIRSYVPLSDMDPRRLESLRHHLLQTKLRFYQARTRAQSVYHERATIDRLFAANHLGAEAQTRIPIKAAAEYFIYRLKRE